MPARSSTCASVRESSFPAAKVRAREPKTEGVHCVDPFDSVPLRRPLLSAQSKFVQSILYVWHAYVRRAAPGVARSAPHRVHDGFHGFLDRAYDRFDGFLNCVHDRLHSFLYRIKDWIKDLLHWIQHWIENILDRVQDLFRRRHKPPGIRQRNHRVLGYRHRDRQRTPRKGWRRRACRRRHPNETSYARDDGRNRSRRLYGSQHVRSGGRSSGWRKGLPDGRNQITHQHDGATDEETKGPRWCRHANEHQGRGRQHKKDPRSLSHYHTSGSRRSIPKMTS